MTENWDDYNNGFKDGKQAGIREAANWVEGKLFSSILMGQGILDLSHTPRHSFKLWQDKLKEWGLSQPNVISCGPTDRSPDVSVIVED